MMPWMMGRGRKLRTEKNGNGGVRWSEVVVAIRLAARSTISPLISTSRERRAKDERDMRIEDENAALWMVNVQAWESH